MFKKLYMARGSPPRWPGAGLGFAYLKNIDSS